MMDDFLQFLREPIAQRSLLAFYLSFPLGWHLGATIILVLGVIFCTAYLYSSRCGRLKQRGKNSSQVQ